MKTLGLTALLSLSALTLQGCSSGLETLQSYYTTKCVWTRKAGGSPRHHVDSSFSCGSRKSYIFSRSITCLTSHKALITRINSWSTPGPSATLAPDSDLLNSAMTIMTKHQMSLVPYHVKSLQDQEVEHTNNLPWLADEIELWCWVTCFLTSTPEYLHQSSATPISVPSWAWGHICPGWEMDH